MQVLWIAVLRGAALGEEDVFSYICNKKLKENIKLEKM